MTRERGLQSERTTLAWQRTGLAGGVVALLLLREGLTRHAPVALAAAASATLAAGIANWPRRPDTHPTPAARLLLVSCLVTGSGLGLIATLAL